MCSAAEARKLEEDVKQEILQVSIHVMNIGNSRSSDHVKFASKLFIIFTITCPHRCRGSIGRLLHSDLVNLVCYVPLQLLHCSLQLLKFITAKFINGVLPPKLPSGLAHLIKLFTFLLLKLQPIQNLSQLHVQILNISISASLENLVTAGGVLQWGNIPIDVTLKNRLNFWIAKRKCLANRRENYDRNFYPTKYTELTGFLEKASSAFRKGDLQIAFLLYLHNWNFPTT